VQSCAPAGGCADCVRHVCTEFVGTGNSVLADVCGNVRLCCTHVCFVWGMPGMPTRVCLGISCFWLLFSDGNSASQARGWALPVLQWILLRRCAARCRPHSHVMGEGSA
jgi:hypothetical protein